ncbi:DUF4914 family protein [Mucisphaera sp.]|uniref:DUF4914 family protein n=1 Tax=Mucisphaera sp. TaxID=2913024 RepID=UPI003D0EEC8D
MTTITAQADWRRLNLPAEAAAVLEKAPSVTVASTVDELIALATRDADAAGWHEVAYDVPGKGRHVEAKACKIRNGVAANYTETYMRRRDPDCMVIGDDHATNKQTFEDRFGKPFAPLREDSFEWLSKQNLALFAFTAGVGRKGLDAVVIAPDNAGFFALGLALLQGIRPLDEITDKFKPSVMIYVAPPFRHTHFDGKQVVVHNRTDHLYELFSYNLYPGPSAKKGIYGVLIDLGEKEGWVTAHCSTVQVVTPYDNSITIMHEGASGGGKSEMLEHAHRGADGRLRIGKHIQTGEKRKLTLPHACKLHPVTDDMALCPSYLQDPELGKLRLRDAEDAWFVRVNHIERYGVDPHLERLTIEARQPLLFLNIDAQPNSTALIWEHIEDEPGQPCPNPRVVVPRSLVPRIVDGPVTVDVRSFGVRTPPCTRENPSYGILGLFHILPPALAWLWRLTAPRGHANPSIVDTQGMTSEGVGSYWPFASGRRVDQANLLLRQIFASNKTLFVLCPNQHVGVWAVSFMPQWITREYLARRGDTPFRPEQLTPARSNLLGYTLKQLQVEGTPIDEGMLRVETQPEVGTEAYDAGDMELRNFFREQLEQFLEPDLHPHGRRIIEACLNGATAADYEELSIELDEPMFAATV